MFRKNVLLSRHSSYKIGGPAAYFAEPKTAGETIRVLSKWHEISKNFSTERRQIFILGGGTNILFSDDGFPGLILKPNIIHLRKAGNQIVAGASISMARLLAFAIKHRLGSLEWSGGLPGTLGGAIRGNAGCFGVSRNNFRFNVTSLNYEDGKPKIITRNNAQCKFSYRDSIFKYNDEIIFEVTLGLKKGDKKELAKASEEKKTYRKERHPLEYPNIGSIFKNVSLKTIIKAGRMTETEARARFLIKEDPFPVVPTARLISECGLKGTKSGGAMVSEKHANFIVNVSNASSSDVKKLIQKIKNAVYRKFRVKLEEEVLVL